MKCSLDVSIISGKRKFNSWFLFGKKLLKNVTLQILNLILDFKWEIMEWTS